MSREGQPLPLYRFEVARGRGEPALVDIADDDPRTLGPSATSNVTVCQPMPESAAVTTAFRPLLPSSVGILL